MSDVLNSQTRNDFNRARFKSFLNRVFSILSGKRNSLLSYDEVKEKLKIGGPIYRGVKTVRVEDIAGSLNRYHEFDNAFLPKEGQLAGRWQKVDRAFYEDIHLPPVVLYKVGRSISWWTVTTAFRSPANRGRNSSKPKCANAPHASTSRPISAPKISKSSARKWIFSNAPGWTVYAQKQISR